MYSFRMCSNLSYYELKIDCYKYRLLYVSPVVIKKQKPMVGTQKNEKGI